MAADKRRLTALLVVYYAHWLLFFIWTKPTKLVTSVSAIMYPIIVEEIKFVSNEIPAGPK